MQHVKEWLPMTNVSHSNHSNAPGPRGHPEKGCLPELQRDPLAFFMSVQRQYGDVAQLRMGPDRVAYLVSHPDLVRQVLVENRDNYTKGEPVDSSKGREDLSRRGVLLSRRFLLGNGLLTSEGDLWTQQRRLMQPIFTRPRLAPFVGMIHAAVANMLVRWHDGFAGGRAFDVAEEMKYLGLRIIGTTIFGADLTPSQSEQIIATLGTLLDQTNARTESQFDVARNQPAKGDPEFRRLLQDLDRIVYDMIERRRNSGQDTGDFLSMLVFERDEETGQSMDDQQIRDEVVTIFLAGHETTASAMSWTLYLLACHPEVQSRFHRELDGVLGQRAPEAGDLINLKHTSRVLEESMRLFPPAWLILRYAVEGDQLGGYPIPAGADIIISPYVVHRHEDFWNHPDSFVPDRFEAAVAKNQHHFAYIPFGAGPRLCIGRNFATMEAALTLAMIGQRYSLAIEPEHATMPKARFILQPENGIWVTLQPRKEGKKA